MKKMLGLGLAGLLTWAGTAVAESEVGVGLDVAALSSYVWRGQTLNDKMVVQPSLTASKAGFAINTWANYNVDGAYDGDFSEVDLTASY